MSLRAERFRFLDSTLTFAEGTTSNDGTLPGMGQSLDERRQAVSTAKVTGLTGNVPWHAEAKDGRPTGSTSGRALCTAPPAQRGAAGDRRSCHAVRIRRSPPGEAASSDDSPSIPSGPPPSLERTCSLLGRRIRTEVSPT